MASVESSGWYVISLRPQGTHAPLRRAAARCGARLLALSPWRLRERDDAQTRMALKAALDADRVLFTSPVAVQAAARLTTLRPMKHQSWLAVGSGTAQALERLGVSAVETPARMDSEGLLALPALQRLEGTTLGFVSAPDGRNLLAPALQARGAELKRADVYERLETTIPASAIRRLLQLDAPACVLISSGGALQRVIAQLPPDGLDALWGAVAIAASERLAQQAEDTGFRRVIRAEGPRPAQLLATAQAAMARHIR